MSQLSPRYDQSANQLGDIRTLKLEVEAISEKLQQYNDIIISQANELKILREILCVSCKRRFIEASVAPSPSSPWPSRSNSPNESDRKPFSRETAKKTGSVTLKSTSPSNTLPRSSAFSRSPPTSRSANPARSPSKSPLPIAPTSFRSAPRHTRRIGTTNDISSSSRRTRDSESSRSVTHSSNAKGSTLPDLAVRTSNLTNPHSKSAHVHPKVESISSSSAAPLSNHNSDSEPSWSLTRNTNTRSSTPPSESFTFTLISSPSQAPDSEAPWSRTYSSDTQASASPSGYLTFPLDSPPSLRLETSNDDPDSDSVWSVTHSADANQGLDIAFERALPHNGRVNCVKFTTDGRYLAVGLSDGESNRWDGKAIIYNTETGMERCRLVEYEYTGTDKKPGIDALCFSPNGKQLAIGHRDGHISLWLIDMKRVRNMFGRGDLSVTSLDFSPNGQTLVSASLDGTVRVWSVRDGSPKQILVTTSYTDLRVAFNPKGRYIAAGTGDGVLCILDSRTQQLVKKWEGHQNEVSGLAFLPKGEGLLSSSFDGIVKYWDVGSLEDIRSPSTQNLVTNSAPLIRQFGGYPHHIRSIATSADGRWVLCGMDDSSARIWNIFNGMQECNLHGHTRRVWAVDTSSVGNYLAMGDIDGRVSLWRMK